MLKLNYVYVLFCVKAIHSLIGYFKHLHSDWLKKLKVEPIAARHWILQINLHWRHLTVGLYMIVYIMD